MCTRIFDLARAVRRVVPGMVCFAAALVSSGAVADSGCFVDKYGTRGCPVGPGPGPGPGLGGGDPPSTEDREKSERIEKANDFNEKGIAAWDRGEWGVASEQFRQAHAWNPDSKIIFRNLTNARHKLGLEAMERGDWEYAAGVFKSLLRQAPDSQEFQRLSAAAEEKREAMRLAYKLDREATTAWERGDYREALRLLRRLQILRDERGVRDDIAKLEKYLGDMEKKELGDGYDRQARSAKASGDFGRALKLYKQALATYANPTPEYRQFVADFEKEVQKHQERVGVAEVQSNIGKIAEKLKNQEPVGDLDFDDFASTGDAFGGRKSNPTPGPAAVRRRAGHITDPGQQLKSVEGHSSDAKSQRNDSAREIAREGFDTPGANQGTLVYPDKIGHRQLPPTALDKQIPAGAMNDPEIRKTQAWYRSLDVQKADKEQKIAEIKEQQKTSKDPSLAMKIATLNNDMNRLNEDQAAATKTVKARVAVIKKRTLDKGLTWDESPPSDAPSAKK